MILKRTLDYVEQCKDLRKQAGAGMFANKGLVKVSDSSAFLNLCGLLNWCAVLCYKCDTSHLPKKVKRIV